jgi:hypothetical protein
MQHKAMSIMSRKMAAAQQLEGEFSAEGLAAMAGDDNIQMAMAKSMADQIDARDMQRSWSKVKSSKKRKVSSASDHLSPEAQAAIVGSTAAQMIEETLRESKSSPLNHPRILQGMNTVATMDYEDVEETEEELDEEYRPYAEPAEDKCRDCGKHLGFGVPVFHIGICEDCDKLKPEPVVLRVMSEDDDNDEDFDTEPDDIPELSEEVLAKMFANMREHGLV